MDWVIVSSVLQLALMLLGVIVTLQEDWAKRRKMLVLFLFIALGIFGLLPTIMQSRATQQADAKLSQSLDGLQKSSDETQRLTNLNTQLQEKLLASSATITELAKQGIDTAIGGDSFCYVFIRPDNNDMVFIHRGKFPLYGVNARIVDLNKFRDVVAKTDPAKPTAEEQKILFGSSVGLNELRPGSAASVRRAFSIGDSDRQDFNIFFDAPNGRWEQLLRLRKIEGKWIAAMLVRGHGKKKPLYQDINKDFPRNPKGEVDWE